MVKIHKLVRSKRKTLALIVESDGTLTVRAPFRMKQSDILGFVDSKKAWIEQKQAQIQILEVQPHQYVEGEKFLFLGDQIPLRILPSGKPTLVLNDSFNITITALPQADSIFEAWYKKQAREILTERVLLFSRNHNFKPGKIRISSAKTRWGSCSAKGALSFTWRLVMAPLNVIDYVVVHELCHLKEMNHSKAFWQHVESIMPDYKLKRKWLKENGGILRNA